MTPVSDADIRAYREDGAVCLRGVFAPRWRDLAARGIEYNLVPTFIIPCAIRSLFPSPR